MGSTNTTNNYQLSQFISTDKPAWLQDYNGDMTKIDNGIHAAKVAADSAQSTADSAVAGLGTASSDITALQTTVAGQTASIANNAGAINTIQSLIGNGTPTTTDQTIIGAINEINADVTDVKSDLSDIGEQVFLASSSSTTWQNMSVNLDEYRFILATYANDGGKIYLSSMIPKSLFITRDSANKSFAPECYTSERNGGEFYYNQGVLYYRKSFGSLTVSISGIK